MIKSAAQLTTKITTKQRAVSAADSRQSDRNDQNDSGNGVRPTFQNYQQLRVGYELMDTAWRMTVPVVLFAGLGIFIDRSIGSRPWVTLLGTVIGFVFAGLLVKRQIGNVPPFVPSASYKADGTSKAKPKDSRDKKYRILGYDDGKDYYSQDNDNDETNLKDNKITNGKDDI